MAYNAMVSIPDFDSGNICSNQITPATGPTGLRYLP